MIHACEPGLGAPIGRHMHLSAVQGAASGCAHLDRQQEAARPGGSASENDVERFRQLQVRFSLRSVPVKPALPVRQSPRLHS